MDKKTIKTFAIESRKKLIEEVKYQASLLGITAKSIAEPVEKAEGIEVYDIGASNPNSIYDEAIKQRKSLVKRINEKGFDNVVEEVAYTWFNRIIAIRFMEVNDYLPTRVRVLSSQTEGKIEPDIVTEAPHMDLGFTEEEIEQIYQLKNDNKLDELFRLLFIKQCNKLNEILPELFEKTADYTELLLSISFANEEGVIRQLIDSISEDDFMDQVEVIGWLYQYYITEVNDFVYDGSMKRNKIPKELLPAATQIFTPHWPIEYMVENSLGKLWFEQNPETEIKKKWNYFLFNQKRHYPSLKNTFDKLHPKNLKIIDPAMGSGHILIYVFEVLMQIYNSVGFSKKDATVLILENNLYGMEIDDRAYQIAYFAVMMKAREYDKNIFKKYPKIHLTSINESNKISKNLIEILSDGDESIKRDLEYLVYSFKDAKEYGSILKLNFVNINNILNHINRTIDKKYSNSLSPIIFKNEEFEDLMKILKQSELFLNQYDVVITNPPYLNRTRMDKKLSEYTEKNYPNSKSDLVTIFYEKAIDDLCKENGFISFITTSSWMFLKTFENFRKKFIDLMKFESLVDFGSELFDGKVGHNLITACIAKKSLHSDNFIAIKLTDYCYSRRYEKRTEFLNRENYYYPFQENFLKIPGSPIAYWASEQIINIYKNFDRLSNYAEPKSGIMTGNNAIFMKLWFEIGLDKINFTCIDVEETISEIFTWYPYNKGGEFRRWYGNHDYVVNMKNKGHEIAFSGKNNNHRLRDFNFYFKKGITWTALTAYKFNARYCPPSMLCDSKGPLCYIYDENNIYYILGLINSVVAQEFFKFTAPTLDFNLISLGLTPITENIFKNQIIHELVEQNIKISKTDWDSFETSWNFKIHPLLKWKIKNKDLKIAFNNWQNYAEKQFKLLKNNEEKLNKIFIDIYNLNDELRPEIENKDVTIKKVDIERDIKSFVSYVVGCILGRYSLDEEGITFAGGLWDSSKYVKFLPDEDNIIPISDTEYFEDDIVGKFIEFVKVTFGEDNLEDNLDFIASALKKKGTTSRDVIRNYFLMDFYRDHLKTYKKHPIYWLFDSGKNNGFKALIYMHRYETDLVARVRTDYLHKTQKALETAIANNERIIENSTNASEKSKAVKTRDKLIKQLEETRKYDLALAHVANQKIEIDLDDGVKVNYSKFQGVEVSSEGQKAKQIDLLKKI